MRVVNLAECVANEPLARLDPHAFEERQFEDEVICALSLMYRNYIVVPFKGTFLREHRRFQPDLAMFSKDGSHWFVIEVELVSHSLKHHVLPQVNAFRYGTPQGDCADTISRALQVPMDYAWRMLELVPYSVAVIANDYRTNWQSALEAIETEYLVLYAFGSAGKTRTYTLEGSLSVTGKHLGFGRYLAADRSIVFPLSIGLVGSEVQFCDRSGQTTTWTLRSEHGKVWASALHGAPSIPDRAPVQLLRSLDGAIQIRVLVRD